MSDPICNPCNIGNIVKEKGKTVLPLIIGRNIIDLELIKDLNSLNKEYSKSVDT